MRKEYHFFSWLPLFYKGFLRKVVSIFIFILLIQFPVVQAQKDDAHETENRLKKAAAKYFDQENYIEAYPLYSQLLSLYPRNPNYNYRFGACMLFTKADKNKAQHYLEFALKQADVDDLAYYYMGRVLHLNYHFDEAVRYYKKFEEVASSSSLKNHPVKRLIEMCANGKQLLANLQGLDVLRKKELNLTDYMQGYNMRANGGILLSEPEEFKTKLDKQMKENNMIYLTPDKSRAFFSSYGILGNNGRDIYMVKRNLDGTWGTPEDLGTPINTEFDEDYPVYDAPRHTLYFCSEGHNSMGGYDIFRSVYNEALNTWTDPVNLDFPINTPDDDVLFVPDTTAQTAYFSSTRSSPQGTIDVYKIAVHLHALQTLVIVGKAYSDAGKTPALCIISVKDIKADKIIGEYKSSSEDGKYSFNLPNGGVYNYTVETSGRKTQSKAVVFPVIDGVNAMKQEISYDSAGTLHIGNYPPEAPRDSDFQLAYNYIREQAQMNVSADSNSIEALLSESSRSSSASGAGRSTKALNVKNNSSSKGTKKSPDTTQLDYAQLAKDEKFLNDDASKAVYYASDQLEEAQQLQQQARDILNNPKLNGTAGLNADSVAFAKNLQAQSTISEDKGLKAYQLAAEYKNEAIEKQLQIAKGKKSDTGIQNHNSDVSERHLKPVDFIRRQAQKVKEDSFDVARTIDELTQNIKDLNDKTHDLMEQAAKTNDEEQKIIILKKINSLSKVKQAKQEQLDDNDNELKEFHNEYAWLMNNAKRLDSTSSVLAADTNNKVAASSSVQSELKLEINNYVATNNYAPDSGVTDPDNDFKAVMAYSNSVPTHASKPETVNNSIYHHPKATHNDLQTGSLTANSAQAGNLQNTSSNQNSAINQNGISANNNQTNSVSATDVNSSNRTEGNNITNSNGINSHSNSDNGLAQGSQNTQTANAVNNTVPINANNNSNIPAGNKGSPANSQITSVNSPLSSGINQNSTSGGNSSSGNTNRGNASVNNANSPADTMVSGNNNQLAFTNNSADVLPNNRAANSANASQLQTDSPGRNNNVPGHLASENGDIGNSASTNNRPNNNASSGNLANNNSADSMRGIKTANNVQSSFGYHKVTMTNDGLLDSLANIVSKSSGSRLSASAKNKDYSSTVQYTDTAASALNQKSENYFGAASTLVDNSDKIRGNAQNESDRNKAGALYKKADSLDDLIFRLNLKGDEMKAEANYRQYLTNENQIFGTDIKPTKDQEFKFSEAGKMINEADESYKKSVTEKNQANETAVLATKHSYIKSAMQGLSTAILKQQGAIYLYFQIDSEQRANTNAGNTLVLANQNPKTKVENISSQVNPSNISNSRDVNNNQVTSKRGRDYTSSDNSAGSHTDATSLPEKATEIQTTNGENNSSNNVANTSASTASGNGTRDNITSAKSEESVSMSATANIFIDANRSAYSDAHPIPIDPQLPMGLFFQVQVGAFKNPIPQNTFKGFEPIMGLTSPLGYIRYSAGLFRIFDPAKDALGRIKNMGYPDAFIIAFYDGRRITIKEALEKLGISTLASSGNNKNSIDISADGMQANLKNNLPDGSGNNRAGNPANAAQVSSGNNPSNTANASQGNANNNISGNNNAAANSTNTKESNSTNNPADNNATSNTTPFLVQAGMENNDLIPGTRKEKKKRKKKKGNENITDENNLTGEEVSSRPLNGVWENESAIVAKNTITPSVKTLIDGRKRTGRNIKDNVPPPAIPFRKVKGLVYTVQVGSFPKRKDFKRLGKIKQLYSAVGEDSAIKYNSGIYSNLDDAKAAREIIIANTPIKDAFVTAYYNGNRISLSRANELLLGNAGKTESAETTASVNNNNKPGPSSQKTGKENNPIPGTNESENNNDETTNSGFEYASRTRVIYVVQIASYTKDLPEDTANIILQYANEGIVAQKGKHGVVTYFAGNYADIEAANLLKQQLYNEGFHQCHTVAYYHGKKISLQEAQGIPNK